MTHDRTMKCLDCPGTGQASDVPIDALAPCESCHGSGRDSGERYRIVRFYHPSTNRRPRRMHHRGLLTLGQAQAHCSDPATRCEGVYFDGYERA